MQLKKKEIDHINMKKSFNYLFYEELLFDFDKFHKISKNCIRKS